MAETAGWNYYL